MLRSARLIRSAILTAAVALVAMPACAQNGDRAPPAVAIAADLAASPAGTKLTLTLSKPVDARAFVMERPDRAVIDLAEVNFQLAPETGRRREGLVQSFRYGLFAPGRSRIVVDLAGPATVGRIETATRPRDGAVILTVPFQRADRESFRKAATAGDLAPAAGKAVAP
ncbi:AMIN domain-containing protein, partial [Methylobacterium sp. WL6]|uniref:AMIN domain-containing protein n=1 Tax=Methylobacterium sp. WL6 TaxID=2603901 RepID=UPI0011C88193